MLNNNDVSDYLKISPTGLEVSNGFIYLFNDKIVLLLNLLRWNISQGVAL